MKNFRIPEFYKSSVITKIKHLRKSDDPKKKDFTPTELDFGPVKFLLARHLGFCYGVENAIEIAYRTIEENPGKRIFLLSEMIHNPGVNEDLKDRGVEFLMDTSGNFLEGWNTLNSEDIVVIPAFGTTLEIEKKLNDLGINPYKYNTTCPFVEKVWNRSEQLGQQGYTLIIHGKHYHEETRATFSHSKESSPTIIIRDFAEAKFLTECIRGKKTEEEFKEFFKGKYSINFNPAEDLYRVGVVNQTTMLASETGAIADLIKESMAYRYGEHNLKFHFADTKDTLCYATNDNQDATYGLLNVDCDLAIVVGGYNSSNTSHIVELCGKKFKTFFISSPDKIISSREIKHFDIHSHSEKTTRGFLPKHKPVRIILTSGASCPDAIVEEILYKILSYYPDARPADEVFDGLTPFR